MKTVVAIILLALLPQLLEMLPRGASVCLAADHIAIDCHTTDDDHGAPEHCAFSADEACSDIHLSGIESTPQRPTPRIELPTVPCLQCHNALNNLAPQSERQELPTSPPRFAARAHSRCITPRF